MEIKDTDLTEIYLMLQDLDNRLTKLEATQPEVGVITNGAPQFVKDFLSKIKEGTK